VGVDEFLTDLSNGTLPAVSYIEPGYNSGLDEHPGVDDTFQGRRAGGSEVRVFPDQCPDAEPSWKGLAFILTYDEFGGFYEHVPPQPQASPDGIKPMELSKARRRWPDFASGIACVVAEHVRKNRQTHRK